MLIGAQTGQKNLSVCIDPFAVILSIDPSLYEKQVSYLFYLKQHERSRILHRWLDKGAEPVWGKKVRHSAWMGQVNHHLCCVSSRNQYSKVHFTLINLVNWQDHLKNLWWGGWETTIVRVRYRKRTLPIRGK